MVGLCKTTSTVIRPINVYVYVYEYIYIYIYIYIYNFRVCLSSKRLNDRQNVKSTHVNDPIVTIVICILSALTTHSPNRKCNFSIVTFVIETRPLMLKAVMINKTQKRLIDVKTKKKNLHTFWSDTRFSVWHVCLLEKKLPPIVIVRKWILIYGSFL